MFFSSSNTTQINIKLHKKIKHKFYLSETGSYIYEDVLLHFIFRKAFDGPYSNDSGYKNEKAS